MDTSEHKTTKLKKPSGWLSKVKNIIKKKNTHNIDSTVADLNPSRTFFTYVDARENDELQVNLPLVSIMSLLIFSWDIIFSFLATHFGKKGNQWKMGVEWTSHIAMGSYLCGTTLLEMMYFLYAYRNSKVGNSIWPKFKFCVMNSLMAIVARMDLYSDINLMYEIDTCSDEYSFENINESMQFNRSLGLQVLRWTAFLSFFVSISYQLVCFIRMMLWCQLKSTFDAVFANTSALCHSANLKLLASLVDRFKIDYYGSLFVSSFNARKAISCFKIVFEDGCQMVIQCLFLIIVHGQDSKGDENGNDSILIISVVFSMWISLFSAFLAFLFIRSDATSVLSAEDKEYVVDKMKKGISISDSSDIRQDYDGLNNLVMMN